MTTSEAADIPIAERLREMLDGVVVSDAAAVAGCSANTLRRWMSATSSIDAKGAARLTEWRERSLEWLLLGANPEPNHSTPNHFSLVKVIDARVSAGPGASVLAESAASHMAFPTAWLKAVARKPDELAIVTVQGDSMEPDLRAGDQVMVDPTRNTPHEGMYVLRLDDELLVKRVQRIASSEILLLSANPAYDPRKIDLTEMGDSFSIIGRAIWLGRTL